MSTRILKISLSTEGAKATGRKADSRSGAEISSKYLEIKLHTSSKQQKILGDILNLMEMKNSKSEYMGCS